MWTDRVESPGRGWGCLSTLQLMEDMDRCNGLAVDSPDLEEAYGHVDPWGFIKKQPAAVVLQLWSEVHDLKTIYVLISPYIILYYMGVASSHIPDIAALFVSTLNPTLSQKHQHVMTSCT